MKCWEALRELFSYSPSAILTDSNVERGRGIFAGVIEIFFAFYQISFPQNLQSFRRV
jgi:hypothetical protein